MKYATISISLCLFLLCTQGARADAKPGFVKVMLERNHAENGGPPAEVVSRLGGQAVKTYPAYTVIRVPENRRQEVAAVARGAGFHATIQDDWDKVFTPGSVIDTRFPRLPDAGVLSGYPGGREGLYVLQFEAPLDTEWAAEIEKAGLRYVSYLPYNAALVYGSQSAVARAAALPHVQWSSLYHPAFRAQPADLGSSDAIERYVVQLVDAPDSQEVVKELRAASQSEEEVAPYGPYLNVTIEVHPEVLRRLIGDPRVVAIERGAQWMTSGEREAVAATSSTSVDFVFQDGVQPYKNTGHYENWLAYRGIEAYLLGNQLVAIADQGLAGGSPSLMNPEY